MPNRLKAIIALALIAPVLTEIVSGNTLPHALLHPSVAFFLIAVYSLPLLLIRELSIRWRLRVSGIFLLGLAYGLLNEGLVAQTLIRYGRVPVANFDHYTYAAGINFAWTALIVPWHAFMAVLFPLALLGLWFRDSADTVWLDRKWFIALTVIVGGGVIFLGLARTPRFQMRAFLVAMTVLVATARLCAGRDVLRGSNAQGRPHGFAAGAIFYTVLFLGATTLAGRKVAPELYFLFVAAVIAGFAWFAWRFGFNRLPNAAFIALGAYCAAALFNFLSGVMRHSPEASVCGAAFAVAFIWLWQYSRRGSAIPAVTAEP